MSNRTTRIWVLSLLLAVCVCATGYAANVSAQRNGLLQGYVADGQELSLLVNHQEDGVPSPRQFAATINDQTTEVSRVDRAAELPVTYYCLVDISGSLNQEQLAQEKDALRGICAGLSPEDQMVIALLGNDVTPGEYMRGADGIEAAIDSIEIQRGEDTNLYGGIVSSMQALQTNNQSTVRKCLVVLTDGEDDQKSSYTQDEVDRAVRESGIPFYGVAVMKSSQANDSNRIAYAKILGSFARESAGGVYYNPVLDGNSASSAGESICANMRSDWRVFLDLSALDSSVLPAGAGSVPLKLRYSTDSATYEDAVAVDTADLRPLLSTAQQEEGDASESPTPEASVSGASLPDPDKPDHLDSRFPVWIWIAIAAAVIVVFVLFILFTRKRGKEESRVDEEDPENQPEDFPPVEDYDNNTAAESIQVNFPETLSELPTVPLRKVVFTALNYRNIRFEVEIPEGPPVTLGRDRRADVILNPQDNRLSGINSRVQLKGTRMLVWDENSTNGTVVNGVPLRNGANAVLESGQTLRMGSYEYRVEFF